MDEITRNSLPYYENQLRTSLNIIESLSEQISNYQEEEYEIVVKVQDGSMETWQILADLEVESEEIIEDIEQKNQMELEEYKDVKSEQDKQLLELHQQLDVYHDQLLQLNNMNNQEQEGLDQQKMLLLESHQQLQQLYFFIDEQNNHNKNVQKQIKRIQKNIKLQQDHPKSPIKQKIISLPQQSSPLQEITNEGESFAFKEKQIRKNRKSMKDEKRIEQLYNTIQELTSQKEQLEEEIDKYLKCNEGTIEDMMREIKHLQLSHQNSDDNQDLFIEELIQSKESYSVQLISTKQINILHSNQIIAKIKLKQEASSFQKMVQDNLDFSTNQFCFQSDAKSVKISPIVQKTPSQHYAPIEEYTTEEKPKSRSCCECSIF